MAKQPSNMAEEKERRKMAYVKHNGGEKYGESDAEKQPLNIKQPNKSA